MKNLLLDVAPSDIDLQISSDAIVQKCESIARERGDNVLREKTFSNAYDFIRKDLLRAAMRHLTGTVISCRTPFTET